MNFSVKETVLKTGLSEHTLRYYEKIGLIGPIRRSQTGCRQYSEADHNWIEFLKCLKSTGMSIEHMIEYTGSQKNGDRHFDKRLKLLKEHKSIILKKIEELQSFLSTIEWKIDFYTKEKEKILNETNTK